MEVKIEKIDHQGRGIVKKDKPIFIENTLPDEIVDIDIIEEKKKYSIGIVKKYCEKSIKRIEPQCLHYNSCGGCNIMHMDYQEQLNYKKNKVQEIINKYAKEKIKINDIISSEQFNYRNKTTFHVNKNIGYYKNKTYEIIPIDNCMIVDKKINNILEQIKNIDLNNVYEIVIRVTNTESMLIFKCNDSFKTDISSLDVSTILIYINDVYKVIKGKGYITEKINNYNFVISPDSFFQVNTKQMIKLYDKVLEYAKLTIEDEVLDLYCGTGTIGIWLSKYCKKVYGIEINKYAIQDAIKNKESNKIDNIDFKCDNTSNIINSKKYYNKIIIDPPRSGLDEKTISYLLKVLPDRIVYVSCDPITLARDLNLLKEKYVILEITPIDMFPNTYHIENVALLCCK